jgi:hypothetical protein
MLLTERIANKLANSRDSFFINKNKAKGKRQKAKESEQGTADNPPRPPGTPPERGTADNPPRPPGTPPKRGKTSGLRVICSCLVLLVLCPFPLR